MTRVPLYHSGLTLELSHALPYLALSFMVALASMASAQVTRDKVGEPSPAAQNEAKKTIKELFKREYASRNPEERKAFANKLVSTARETRDNSALRFVLFREALDISTDLGDARTAVRVIDEIAERFVIDALAMKAEALAAAGKKVEVQADLENLLPDCLDCLDKAAQHFDFKNGKALAAVAKAAVRTTQNVWLSFNVEVRSKRLDRLAHY